MDPVERVVEINGAAVHYWVYGPANPASPAGSGVPGSLELPASPAGPENPASPENPEGPGNRARPAEQDLHEVPVTVMVHGLRGTHQGMELIARHLAHERPGDASVLLDLPGFGESSPMVGRGNERCGHDVPGYAAAVTTLLERLGAGARPVVLLGHSFGSVISAHVASRAPQLVRRLVLVNPIATPALRGPRSITSSLTSPYFALGKLLPERTGRALLSNRWIVLGVSRAMTRTKDRQLRRFIDDSHLRYFSRFHSPALLSEAFRASVTRTAADYADSLAMPTLLIAGETDKIAPLAGQRALAGRLPHSRLVVIPDVGHLVHYETPGAAAAEIQRFLVS